MKLTLQIISWVAVVLGALAILGSVTQPTMEDAYYSLLGGGLFMLQGILSLVYVRNNG